MLSSISLSACISNRVYIKPAGHESVFNALTEHSADACEYLEDYDLMHQGKEEIYPIENIEQKII
jgi:hypothetical protein